MRHRGAAVAPAALLVALAAAARVQQEGADPSGRLRSGSSPTLTGAAPDKHPDVPRIRGGFIQYQGWMMDLTADGWRRELAAMREAGMDTVIVQWLSYEGQCYIPHDPKAVDPTEVILSDADRNGMQVFLGLTMDNGWWSRITDPDYLGGAARAATAMADRAWKLYGSHPSFTGWYIPQEPWDAAYTDGQIDLLRAFYRRITVHCDALSAGKPVGCSPFFTGSASPDVVERVYIGILQGSGLDILMPQDSVGARGWDKSVEAKVVPYFRAFRGACDAAGLAMWSDLESFHLASEQPLAFTPATMERIERQINAEAPFVSRFVTFDFFHYMSPYRNEQTKRLYHDYTTWLKHTRP